MSLSMPRGPREVRMAAATAWGMKKATIRYERDRERGVL